MRRSRTTPRWLLLPPAVAALAAAGSLVWHMRVQRDSYFTDDDTIHEPLQTAATRPILWRPPEPVTDVNTAVAERDPSPGADAFVLCFARPGGTGGYDLFVSVRSEGGWGPPEPLSALNSEFDELGPHVSPGGDRLYFSSDRPGGSGFHDLWVSRRSDGRWEAPVNLGPQINSRYNDHSPGLAPDGRTLYFASDRPGPHDPDAPAPDAWAARIAEYLVEADDDLYVVDLEIPQEPAAFLESLNGPADDTGPAVSPVGDFVYFASDRDGGEGGFDLYRARRYGGGPGELPGVVSRQPGVGGRVHGAPEALRAPVCGPHDELDPAPCLGGFGLHFSSNRAGSTDQAGARDYDLYFSESREVFARTLTHRASIAWGSVWSMLWPFLAAGLLLAAILLVALRLLEQVKARKLSLVVRCMLVSLVVHMIGLVGLGFWMVETGLPWVRPAGGVQVALVAPAAGPGIARQIRGSIARLGDAPPEAPPAQQRGYEPAPAVQPAGPLVLEPATEHYDAGPAPVTLYESTAQRSPVAVAETLLPEPSLPLPSLPAPDPRAEEAPAQPDVRAPAAARAASALAPSIAAASSGPRLELPGSAGPSEPLPPIDPREAAPAAGAIALVADPPTPRALAELPDLTVPRLPQPEQSAGPDPSVAQQRPLASALPAAPAPVAGPIPPPLQAAADVAPVTIAADLPDVLAEVAAFESARPGSREPTATGMAPALPDLRLPSMPELPATSYRQAARPLRAAAGGPIARGPVAAEPPPDAPIARVHPQPAHGAGAAVPLRPPPPADSPSPGAADSPPDAFPVGLSLDLAPLPVPVVDAAEAPGEPNRADAAASRMGWPGEAGPEIRPAIVTLRPRVVRRPPESLPARVAESPAVEAPREIPQIVAAAVQEPPDLPEDLSVPTRTIEDIFPFRAPEKRRQLVELMGGDVQTEKAVETSLRWLARHQSAEGHWDSFTYDRGCGHCPGGPQQNKVDIALTGLSTLCFLAAGHAPDRAGQFGGNVSRALDWLLARQALDGSLLADESMYSHGIATIALAEALGMTGDPRFAGPVKRGVDFIFRVHNVETGGWRYQAFDAGDTSVTGWQVMALAAARRAGVEVRPEAFEVGRRWMKQVEVPRRSGEYSYLPGEAPRLAMTAEGMFVYQLLGVGRHEPRMRASARVLADNPPRWRGDPNSYYWYYATLALYQHQGEEWRKWNEAVKEELVEHQIAQGPAAGSWPTEALDRWSMVGGRVYQTAICTLTLEVYYRYLPGFVQAP